MLTPDAPHRDRDCPIQEAQLLMTHSALACSIPSAWIHACVPQDWQFSGMLAFKPVSRVSADRQQCPGTHRCTPTPEEMLSQAPFLLPGARLSAPCRRAPSHSRPNQLWALKGVIFFLILPKPDSIHEAPFNRSQFTKKKKKKDSRVIA